MSTPARQSVNAPRLRSLSLGFVAAIAALATVACGSDSASGGSPSAPSSTTTAVNVTVESPVRMGQTTQATGTATRSNGQSDPITSGWQSDAPTVASVTNTGLVSALSNGRATIYVVTGGRQGQQVIRVVPDYQGEWSGNLRTTGCTESGVVAAVGLCSEFPVNGTDGFDLTFAQMGEALNATAFFGSFASPQTVGTSIGADGSAAFSATFANSDQGVTITVESAWTVNSLRVGELTGTLVDTWRVAGFAGEGRIEYTVISASRGRSTLRPDDSSRVPSMRLRDRLQRLSH